MWSEERVMDWMQTLTVLGVFIGGFLFMMSRIDKIADSLRKEIVDSNTFLRKEMVDSNTSLRKDMDSKLAQVEVRLDALKKEISDSNASLRKDMDSKFAQVDVRLDALKKEISDSNTSLRKDMADLNAKVSNIEGQITQMTRPKIIHFRDEEERKEN